jgi:hypothetical protein
MMVRKRQNTPYFVDARRLPPKHHASFALVVLDNGSTIDCANFSSEDISAAVSYFTIATTHMILPAIATFMC